MSARRVDESCRHHRKWLAGQKPTSRSAEGRFAMPGFTGYDSAAFDAWCHLLEAWTRRDHRSEPRLLVAMTALLDSVQPSVLPAFRDVIPAAMDWTDVERFWPRVVPPPHPSHTGGTRT